MSANTVTDAPVTIPDERKFNWQRWALIPGFAGVIATAAACGGGESHPNDDAAGSAVTSVGTAPVTPCVNHQDPNASLTKAPDGSVLITFDSLCSDLNKGGSNVIDVYPSPGPDGVVHNGTFMNGQQAYAQCKVEGRHVSSVHDEGELPGSSDMFVRLAGADSIYYATVVYVQNRDAVLGALKPCP